MARERDIPQQTLSVWKRDYMDGLDISFDGRKSNKCPVVFNEAQRVAVQVHIRENPFKFWKQIVA